MNPLQSISPMAKYLGAAVALTIVAGSALVYAAVPRIQTRVENWLHPFDDEQGAGYQLVQSLYALAEGGVFGPGLGRGFLGGFVQESDEGRCRQGRPAAKDATGEYLLPANRRQQPFHRVSARSRGASSAGVWGTWDVSPLLVEGNRGSRRTLAA